MLQPQFVSGHYHKASVRKSWILKLCFLIFSLLTVCNLNAVAVNIFDLPQLLSPLIFVFGVIGILSIPRPWAAKISNNTKIFIVLFCVLMVTGWIGLLSDGASTEVWFRATYSLTATIFVFGASALICGRVAAIYGLDWLLMACFIIFGISAASVFIGVINPDWNDKMSNAAAGGRASGFFANPNEAGIQACLFTSIGFALSARSGSLRWLIISLAIAIPAVVFTFSRGSIIALFCVVSSLSFIVFPAKNVFRILILLLVLVAAIFAVQQILESTSSNTSNGALKRRIGLFSELLHGRIDAKTTGGRSVLAKEAIFEWMKSPIYGQGHGALNHMPRTGTGPHNLFLKVLGETGLLGLACLLGGLFVAGLRGLAAKNRAAKVLVVGIVLCFVLDGFQGHGGLGHRNMIFAMGFALALEFHVARSIYR